MQAVFIASILISWAVALFVWTRRQSPGAKQLSFMMGLIGLWGVPFLLPGIDNSPDISLLSIKLEYISLVSIPFFWLWFALDYTGKKEWLTPGRIALLAIMPSITLVLAWTAESHNLIVDFRETPLSSVPNEYLRWKLGVWAWINTYYQYGIFAIGTVILLRGISSLHLSYRSQVIPLVITILFGWGANILYAFGAIPSGLVIAPLSFTFFGLGVSWSLYRHRLLDIVPIARDVLIERISDVVLVLDIQQRIVDINPAGQDLLGEAASPPIGQHIDDIFPGLSDLFQSRIKVPVSVGIKRVDESGERRFYDVSISDLISQQNTLTGYLCVLRDVTELEQLDLAMSGANVGVWDWHLDTNTMHFDNRFYMMAGYEPQEFPSSFEAWVSRIHPEDVERSKDAIDQYIAARIPQYDIQYRFLCQDGTWMWIRSRGKIVEWNDNGVPIRFIGAQFDITALKQAEDRLKASLAEKEVLLRELYHRTKNTLQVIRSMLLLQASKIPENAQAQKLVSDTEDRIMAMALVHQKLYQTQDLSRIPMQDYIRELAHLIMQSHVTAAQDISLTIEIEDLSFLLDTAIPCGLILTELLSNALRHAFPDGRQGQVVIRLRKNNAENLEFCFADNGVGVPSGFDFRGQHTLGFQTVFAIAEHQMQGKVEFISGQGLTCTIEFPDTLYNERV